MRPILLSFFAIPIFLRSQPCAEIAPIVCGQTITFASNSIGDPDYPNGFGHPGWYGLSGQGGPERIFSFIVPFTGTFQVNVLETVGSNSAEFFWKNDTSGCGPMDWNYMGFTNFDDFPITGTRWNAGDNILLLVNQEGQGNESVTFQLVCRPDPCTATSVITCGQQVTYATYGYGDPDYPNGLGHPGWYASAGQGGTESIYRFGVPADGDYALIVVNATDFRPAGFFWKSQSDGCGPDGWNYIGFTDQDGHTFSMDGLTGGDTVLVLLNAESRESATTTFSIDCLGLGTAVPYPTNSLRAWPQPASDQLTLSGWSGHAEGRICDATGTVVMTFSGQAPLMLAPRLAPGTYVIDLGPARRMPVTLTP